MELITPQEVEPALIPVGDAKAMHPTLARIILELISMDEAGMIGKRSRVESAMFATLLAESEPDAVAHIVAVVNESRRFWAERLPDESPREWADRTNQPEIPEPAFLAQD